MTGSGVDGSARSRRDRVRLVVDSFDPDRRAVLAVCVRGTGSVADVAEMLGMSEQSVIEHLHLALWAMRDALEGPATDGHRPPGTTGPPTPSL